MSAAAVVAAGSAVVSLSAGAVPPVPAGLCALAYNPLCSRTGFGCGWQVGVARPPQAGSLSLGPVLLLSEMAVLPGNRQTECSIKHSKMMIVLADFAGDSKRRAPWDWTAGHDSGISIPGIVTEMTNSKYWTNGFIVSLHRCGTFAL